MGQSTTNSRMMAASAGKIFAALTDPRAIELWQVPEEMMGKIQDFKLELGGSYTMSLFYPEGMEGMGKTSPNEDRFISTFLVIDRPHRLVQLVEFVTDDPGFSGKMEMEVLLEEVDEGTKVTFNFANIPKGIKLSDNEEGTESSLEKLARYVEG